MPRNSHRFIRDGFSIRACHTIATERAFKTDGRGTTVNSFIHIGNHTRADDDGFPTDYIIISTDADVHHAVMAPTTALELATQLIWRAYRMGAPLGAVRDVMSQIDAAERPDAA